MAKLTNGFLGNASGKLGNVVFSKWKRINTARTYVGKISDANTPAQKRQRLKMSALQNFLSPLNDSFIKFFNSNYVDKSTPWAKAIKDNMQMVDDLGNINTDLLKLGKEKYRNVNITESSYDPFIDRLTLKYDDPNALKFKSNYPLIANSMLGISKAFNGTYSFNTDNMLSFMSGDIFYCRFEGPDRTYNFRNYFSRGNFWLVPFESYRWDEHHQSNGGNTPSSPFTPLPIIHDFNLDIKDDPVPPSCASVSYINVDTKPEIEIKLNVNQLNPNFSLKNKVKLFIRLIKKDGTVDLTPKVVQLESFPFNQSLEAPENIVGFIILYNVLNEHEEQIGRFNRVYYGKDLKGIETPYFDALWQYYGANPLSFILNDNQSGIFGNIDELCADFISSYQNGTVTGTPEDIDYNDFKIIILSDRGVALDTIQLNDKHEFYYPKLNQNQAYYIAVIYDIELIDSWKSERRKKSKVHHISPSTIVYNQNQDKIPIGVLKTLKPYLSNKNKWDIPMESYTREALFRFQTSNPNKYKKTVSQDYPIILDATLDF